MKSLDLFMSRLVPWVIGAPDPVLRMALIDGAIEFCEMTNICQVITDPVIAVADTSSYTLALPTYHDPVMTLQAWYGSTALGLAPSSVVDSVLAYVTPIGTSSAQKGKPQNYYEVSPGVVAVYPIPTSSTLDYLTTKVAVKPSRDASALDDILFTDWVEAIVMGARKRLHSMPDQMFSSDQKALEATAAFTRYVGKARYLSVRGRVQGSISVKPKPFA